jgi:RNA polymerase sigma-70 factor (ECF subfamily)
MQRALVEQAQRGDVDAYSALTATLTPRLYAVANLILRDQDRAADAVQDTLLKAWQDVHALRDPDRFEAWLHRVLVRTCYAAARRNRVRHLVEIEMSPSLGPNTPDAQVDVAVRDQLNRGFARLSTEHRTVLVLVHYLGLSLAETAEMLGVPLGTVQSRLNRATGTMRAALDADERLQQVSVGVAR